MIKDVHTIVDNMIYLAPFSGEGAQIQLTS